MFLFKILPFFFCFDIFIFIHLNIILFFIIFHCPSVSSSFPRFLFSLSTCFPTCLVKIEWKFSFFQFGSHSIFFLSQLSLAQVTVPNFFLLFLRLPLPFSRSFVFLHFHFPFFISGNSSLSVSSFCTLSLHLPHPLPPPHVSYIADSELYEVDNLWALTFLWPPAPFS